MARTRSVHGEAATARAFPTPEAMTTRMAAFDLEAKLAEKLAMPSTHSRIALPRPTVPWRGEPMRRHADSITLISVAIGTGESRDDLAEDVSFDEPPPKEEPVDDRLRSGIRASSHDIDMDDVVDSDPLAGLGARMEAMLGSPPSRPGHVPILPEHALSSTTRRPVVAAPPAKVNSALPVRRTSSHAATFLVSFLVALVLVGVTAGVLAGHLFV
jgi:hypothetical protein